MKKLVLIVFIFILLLITFPLIGMSQLEEKQGGTDYQVIPDEAIRLRILANSDSDADQELKRMVRDEVNEVITEWVAEITDIEEARKLIEARIPEINEIVKEVLKGEGSSDSFKVEYGSDITFPAKLYGDYVYPAGEYEAVLITIGEGKGDNWWCVLFPPLCFLDFSNGTTVAAEEDTEEEPQVAEEKTEVKFFLFEWFGWS
ncbi:stage II sporulation protein R [Oceanobacillus jordanicus]|uniref:Stage II sporulation protein R n=1 Tax=Oceanobacillus jordanicus TaxID=2867266 RepID=A0AAW5B0G3_9BACI|nr:stage II sporulation protein R [Oceanobacillus jordanicus]MCG3417922.1 stage II sporulation protein R [Oceanobacillus jordanicus]NAP00047.1 stage II sporulation protein R [Halomonas sp. MG34]